MKDDFSKYEKLILHAGTFHADDVGTAALVRMLNPDIRIERVNSVPDDIDPEINLVADIGRGRFDHHQEKGVPVREDGNKRAAIGLVFEAYCQGMFPDEESCRYFEESVIWPIEDTDNGVAPNVLSRLISAMNPVWDSKENPDDAFMRAVNLMEGLFTHEIERSWADYRAISKLQEAQEWSDGITLELDEFIPWTNYADDSYRLAVFPSNRGGYALLCRDKNVTLPDNWEIGDPDGCTFVHPGRFIAVFDTPEQALWAARSSYKEMMLQTPEQKRDAQLDNR